MSKNHPKEHNAYESKQKEIINRTGLTIQDLSNIKKSIRDDIDNPLPKLVSAPGPVKSAEDVARENEEATRIKESLTELKNIYRYNAENELIKNRVRSDLSDILTNIKHKKIYNTNIVNALENMLNNKTNTQADINSKIDELIALY